MAINTTVENINNQPTIQPRTVTGIFTKYIAKTLPLAFDESMSYYECICALLEYLNETIVPDINNTNAGLSELQTFYLDLQNYVNTYFDNLDVQQEINNKLDEMAEDGSLTTLISAYIQPRINEQNQRITQVENMVDAVASGSPLVASSTAEMTNTSRVYVNTSDGNWYYYDGDSWEIGGTYQSTEIADNSVTYNDLQSALKSNLKSENNTTNIKGVQYSIILPDGTYQSGTLQSLGHFEFNVEPFESYKIRISYNPVNWTNSSVRYMFKNNDDIVSYTTKETTPEYEDGTTIYNEIIVVPYNANKLIINCDGLVESSANSINKISNYKQTNISKNDLDVKLQTFFNDIYSDVEPVLLVDNAYMKHNRTLSGYTSSKIYALNVEPGEKYKFTLKQLYTNPALFLTNENMTYTTNANGVEYTLKSSGEIILNETSSYQYENEELVIPDWCKTIYINVANSDSSFNFKKVTSYQVNVDQTDITSNPLNGKTLLFAGDSIMAATSTGVKGWVGIMQENNPNTNFYNYGHDGYTIGKAEDSWNVRSIQNVLSTMLEEHPNADYIVFQGGANDYWGSSHGITIGEISTGFNPNNFDRTSFSGGMEYIINYLYTNFPKTKIVFIVTHQVYASDFYQFMDRAKEICKKWAVPYIDLFDDGNINFQISYMRDRYSKHDESHPTGDGLHPNLDGYEIETPLIENALKYKI